MTLPLRLRALRDQLSASLWLLPTVSVLAAIAAGTWLIRLEVEPRGELARLIFSGTPDGARALLETIAGSVITVTSLTFSLTVVSLQMAATQYTPRLLRNFLTDRGTQIVLSTFVATFAYSITVLRTVRGDGEEFSANVPRLALTVETALALASLAALVYFIHHIAQKIRIENILEEVQLDTLKAVRIRTGPEADHVVISPGLPATPEHATRLHAQTSGFVQGVSIAGLVKAADEHDVVIRIRRTTGEHVTAGTLLGWAWPREGRGTLGADALAAAVNRTVQRGHQRTISGDPSFGVRQLVDVALRALSPSVNDPTTATSALGKLSVILGELAAHPVGNQLVFCDGQLRVALPRPSFQDYLGLAINQIAHYGAGDLAVVRQLLRLLGDLGEVVDDQSRRQTLRAAVERVGQEGRDQLRLPVERAALEEAAQDVLRVIDGRMPEQQPFLL